ncbi:MAG: serine hydrolase [Bacteroidota bacterium]
MKTIKLAFASFILLSTFVSCRVLRLAQFYISENHQKPQFPSRTVSNDSLSSFQFKQGNPELSDFIAQLNYTPRFKNKKGESFELDTYLDKESKTTAFLVIRRDSILFENYYEGYDDKSLLPSFSVAKSFTSALMGIAIQEGKIDSEEDLVIKYLPELKDIHPNWQEVRLKHLLNMRSGLSFNEENYVNPYSGVASLYMAKDVRKVLRKTPFKGKPGSIHYYSSLDTEILGLVLEKALDMPLSSYLETKIWKPCGMESIAEWDIDSEKHQHAKAFCCIKSVARDYAKFGRLYLKNGNWNGKQIIHEDWINKSTQPDFSNNCYQYQWYSLKRGARTVNNEQNQFELLTFADSVSAAKELNSSPYEGVTRSWQEKNEWVIRKCGPGFYALGILGQEVFVNPETEMIFVRLGKKWDVSNQRIFSYIERSLAKAKR